MYTVILLNMVLMILEMTMFDKMMKEDDPEHHARMEPNHKQSAHRKLELFRFSVNIFFFLFYVTEAVLKVSALSSVHFYCFIFVACPHALNI